MKKLIAILCVVMLASCSTYKYNKPLPFATTNRIGQYPTKRNIPVKKKTTWTFKQWGHEGR